MKIRITWLPREIRTNPTDFIAKARAKVVKVRAKGRLQLREEMLIFTTKVRMHSVV